MRSLLVTVKRYDVKWDEDVSITWCAVLAPGIAYMKAAYDPKAIG